VAKKLVNYILQHPDLQGLRRWVLVTKDAQTLYQQLGYKPLKYPERYMEILYENVYAPAQNITNSINNSEANSRQ
ncbi:MAG: hypothetical protein LPK19_12575, partial [Hymenobacteraceae bacterium]|nr:hypothetical protein [Hymenobacteraceae bacterium]MDX5397067.1 hypothetical protein [Hymenobacteraceae bacterium]MDX5513137.1 hypothetical protein [Hymenobacteraceae bacterium]